MARRGASGLRRDDERSGPDRWVASEPAPWEPEVWQEDAEPSAPPRPKGPSGPRRFLPEEKPRSRRRANVPREVTSELAGAVGPTRAPRMAERLAEAARAYERDRFAEARRDLQRLVDEAPGSPAVRELLGLTLYRLGKWREALRHLGVFHEMTGSYDQHPTMEDCHRALRHYPAVLELWEELREASPSAELVTEGRIVAAGALADKGDLKGAISLLERPARRVSRPRDHHLRLWYALADLYERAGEVPAARDLFGRIVRQDRAFFDAAERLSALG